MNKELIEGYLSVVQESIRDYQNAGESVPGDRRLQKNTLEAILELNERLKRVEGYLGVFREVFKK